MKELKIKFGNHKLGSDTGIFNMGSALDCPSKKKGLCKVCDDGIRCYALKAEETYPNVRPYRESQKKYWRETSTYDIGKAILERIKRRRIETKYLRFNESGDFYEQQDVEKLSTVAKSIRPSGITTYGYTARKDLDFSNVHFLVKGSGFDCKNGKTIVISKNAEVPEGFLECPGSCKKCDICRKDIKINIAFRKH